MPCSRRDCAVPGDHAHLRWQDEHAIASVLARAAGERRLRREERERREAGKDPR
jgi:hypothetical protein